MATVKVIDIIRNVEHVLQDTSIRWPRTELQNWLNEAYLAIILMRPDANAKTGTFTCAAGSRQQLNAQFASGLKLLDVTRNLASASDKRAVRLVSRSVLDDQRPTWHGETGTVNIQHYMYDARQPKEFFVYPPATTAAEIEVIYADAVIGHDLYKSPITDWVLYRAYSKDAEYGANEQRAVGSYNAFNTALGAKTQVDAAVSPQQSSSVT